MNKQEFINNIKSHNSKATSFGIKTGVIGGAIILISFLIMWLKPFADLINHKILTAIILTIFTILLMITSSKHEKNNDINHSMFCSKCKKRYDLNTFTIAVLENKCQECGNKIFDP